MCFFLAFFFILNSFCVLSKKNVFDSGGKIFDCNVKVYCDAKVAVETCIFLMGLFLIWTFISVGKKTENKGHKKTNDKKEKKVWFCLVVL